MGHQQQVRRRLSCTNRQLYRVLMFVCAVWLLSSLVIYAAIDYYHPENNPPPKLSQHKLRLLMADDSPNAPVPDPLSQLILQEEAMLSFFHLPRRKWRATYSEITSANLDTSYPLAPDFTFHIRYAEDHVVLYEDYGPGCLYRIYLFPNLPRDAGTIHKMSADDLRDLTLHIEVDGRKFVHSLRHLQRGDRWPFLYPLNTAHDQPASGMGMYTPICYQTMAKISFYPNERLPTDLFQQTVNCSSNDLLCPVHIYSAVSRHKYPPGTKVGSFALPEYQQHHMLESAAALLTKPHRYGPDRSFPCSLTCVPLTSNQQVIYEDNGAGVIAALKIRVLNMVSSHARPASNWRHIQMSFKFDDQQAWTVPLGSLFSAQASMNDHMGAALGRAVRACGYEDVDIDTSHNLPTYAMTGYIYFPMPYWTRAQIMIQATSGMKPNSMLCHQVTRVKNYYNKATTGHFTAMTYYYGEDTSGWRNFLKLNHTWGHIVGLLMEIEDLRARRNVDLNERWAALQSDMVMFVDGKKSAAMQGTGLEDYFSYAHGFALAENTSYAFVGVPHSAPKRKEPLSWHCYRLHILDPVPFNNDIHFIMEGTDRDKFHQPARPLPYKKFLHQRESNRTTFSHMVLYYAKSSNGIHTADSLQVGDLNSEQTHNLQFSNSGKMDTVENVHFIGASNQNTTYKETYRNFSDARSVQFTLTLPLVLVDRTKSLILRRESYLHPKQWNQEASIQINNKDFGTWFIPFGSLVPEYSLKQDDFTISLLSVLTGRFLQGDLHLDIRLTPQSEWNDVAYHLIAVL